MRTVTTHEGAFKFQPSEWRTEKQISGFFSQLAAAQRQKPAGLHVTSEDEVNLTADEDDILSWEISEQEEANRQKVYDEIDINHPISYPSASLSHKESGK